MKLESRASVYLPLILILAFGLRFVGVCFGLPFLYHADEPIVVNHALSYGNLDFNPYFFKIPPLTSYLLFFFYGIQFVVMNLLGLIEGKEGFVQFFLQDPSSFYLIARMVFGVFLGTFSVYLVYKLCKRYISLSVGLFAALFLSVCFLHVRDSHFVYADMPLMCVLIAAFFSIFSVLIDANRRAYLIFGMLLGTAVAFKYNGVFILIPFLVAHTLRVGFSFRLIFYWPLWAAAFISLITFALLNPYAVLDYRAFFSELSGQAGSQGYTGWLHHIQYSLMEGMTQPLFWTAVLGIIVSFLRLDKGMFVLLSFVLSYYVVIVFMGQPYDRYVLPLIPFLIIFSAYFVNSLFRFASFSNWVSVGFVLILIAPSLTKSVLLDQLLIKKDVRSIAYEWVVANLPKDSKLALGTPFFIPRLPLNEKQLLGKQEIAKQSENYSDFQKKRIQFMLEQKKTKPEGFELFYLSENLNESPPLFSEPRIPYDINVLKEMGINYVLIEKVSKEDQPQFVADLAGTAKRVKRFSPYEDESIVYPLDPQPLTGAPFLWSELLQRDRNGQIVEVYSI